MTGIERITTERDRQIKQEGWTAQHDAQHSNEELLDAAICYITNAMESGPFATAAWPWDPTWDKRSKHGPIRSLEIAGALIAAEIDRRLARKEI